jgi:hypothetical protein
MFATLTSDTSFNVDNEHDDVLISDKPVSIIPPPQANE